MKSRKQKPILNVTTFWNKRMTIFESVEGLPTNLSVYKNMETSERSSYQYGQITHNRDSTLPNILTKTVKASLLVIKKI